MAELTQFTPLQLATLSQDYAFYCCVDSEGNKAVGRFIAVPHQEPRSTNNPIEFLFDAFVPILQQPNSPMRPAQVTSTYIDQLSVVTGKNPAATVARTHSQLIRALLA